MKVVSFNVNSLRARLEVVLGWLAEYQPDKGQKSYNGVAIFSKSEIINVKFGFDDEPKDQARFIKAEINGIVIVNTYVPQGYLPESEKFEYKLDWFNRLLTYFDKNFKPCDAVLWVGDFNVAPEPIDVYDPAALSGHVCFHPDAHKALNAVMQWGFVDVFRMHCRQARQYTFWDYRLNSFKRNLGWRLDHIMATEPLAKKSSACYIDKEPRLAERPSDHTPIVAEFDW